MRQNLRIINCLIFVLFLLGSISFAQLSPDSIHTQYDSSKLEVKKYYYSEGILQYTNEYYKGTKKIKKRHRIITIRTK